MCQDGHMDTDRSGNRLQEFWALARGPAHVGDLDVVLGRSWGESLAPPAWSFGGSVEESDALLALVLAKRKTAITELLEEYEQDGEPLPRKGDLSIILDAEGVPHALIRTTEVVVVPFGDVTPEQAAAEGEGDLEAWRASHQAFWKSQGYVVGDETLVVWERFTVVYRG